VTGVQTCALPITHAVAQHRRREGARVGGAAPPRERGAGARARRRDRGRGTQGDPRQDRGADRVILCTRRALWVGAALAAGGVLGLRVPWALDAMLLADVALLAAVWLDARHASPLGERGITVTREAPPAFSVGRRSEVSYR